MQNELSDLIIFVNSRTIKGIITKIKLGNHGQIHWVKMSKHDQRKLKLEHKSHMYTIQGNTTNLPFFNWDAYRKV